MKKILVSACLVGEPVRYDGRAATLEHDLLKTWIAQKRAVVVCPEVSGGLSTPREPAEIVGGDGHDVLDGRARVITQNGDDVTEAFLKGAHFTLALAQKHQVSTALLQERSPSCGTQQVYDGTFSHRRIDGSGVTSALLSRNGIRVFRRSDIVLLRNFLRSSSMIGFEEVLGFWFDGDSKKWWVKSDDFDTEIREQFGEAVTAAGSGELEDWMNEPLSCLALIILLDQFSRNIFRDTAQMFASDERVRGYTKQGVARGFDLSLTTQQRAFFYMPLMHSENLDDHVMSIACFTKLVEDGGGDMASSMLKYEHKHRDIVLEYGRYPHRNELLSRDSTDEEIEFLKGPGSSF